MIYPAISFTPEGGIAVRMINDTGSASVKGEIVVASANGGNKFAQAAANADTPIGIVYDGGIANGSPCRIVMYGRGQVLLKDTVSAVGNYIAYVSSTAGRADASATIPANTQHWREIGHYVDNVTGGTDQLAWLVLHYN